MNQHRLDVFSMRRKAVACCHAARQRALRRLRVVAWADREAIAEIYIEASSRSRMTWIPHDVDHIIPLLGELVSGLHVETNLQIIPRAENRAKSNNFDVDMVGGAGFEPATPTV